MEAIVESLRENTMAWLLVMFLGVLYWAFRGRFRRGGGKDGK